MDLGVQLLLLYLLFVVPVLTGALIFDQFASQRLQNEIMSADLALARAIAQETNTTIRNSLHSVEQLATYEEVIDGDLNGMLALFETVQSVRPDVNLIYRLESDGIMLFHYPLGPGSTLLVDFSFREYFQRATKTREPLVSLGRISPTTEEPVATALMPIWQGDEFLGLVATNIKLQSLSDTLTSIAAEHRPDEEFQVTIVDAAGKVIAHPDPTFLLSDLGEELPMVISAVLSGQSGNQIVENPNGEDILYSYVPVIDAGWGVMVSHSAAVAFAAPTSVHRGAMLLIAVFLGIGLFFWGALSLRVLRPLEHLAIYSQAIGSGKTSASGQRNSLDKLAGRLDQFGHLVRNFMHMEQSIKARINELSTLLDTSAAVVSSLDSQTVLDRILEQVERLMGIKMCAIVALDERSNKFRAQATRGLSKGYHQKLVIDPNEFSSVSLQAIRTRQPVQISDTEQSTEFAAIRARAREEGYRALMAFPLNTHHAAPSALLVYSPQPHVFSEREIDLLTNFGNHAAMAIENATLYARSDARLQRQTRRLEALIQSLEDGLILEDWQGKILYANRRVGELAGSVEAEVLDLSVEALFGQMLSHAVDKEKTLETISASLNGGPQTPVDIALNSPAGKRFLKLKFFSVMDAEGVSIGRGQILQDVTRQRELNRMKSSLISTVSHELRTPLAAIKGYTTTLLADDVHWDPQAQNEFLNIISSEVDRLSKLVTNLLDMSRIEAGNLTISRKACDLSVLAESAGNQAHPQANGRLQIDIPADLPQVYADPARIEAVLRNLIENALKYVDDGSPIRIAAEYQPGRVIVRVEDKGHGIGEEHREHIFESFYREENGLTRSVPGAGLGLAICEGFVHAHGGDIWLEQTRSGTCIAFSLPLHDLDKESHSPGETTDEKYGRKLR
jgi:PAS domain S-box-containing protein